MQKPNIARIKVGKRLAIAASGWWQDRDDDVGVRFHFDPSPDNAHLYIRAFNSHDGEEMKVRRLSVDRRWLSFETTCVSTGFTARHRWRFISKKKAEHELTLPEVWIKASKRKYDYLLHPQS